MGLLLGLLCATAVAQVPGTSPGQAQGQGQQGNQEGPFPGTGFGVDAQGRPLQVPRTLTVPQQPPTGPLRRDELDPIWGKPLPQPSFAGFPTFSSALLGLYPNRGAGDPLLPIPQLPAVDPPLGWPAWVVAASKEPLPHAPDLALLVRDSDRVWRRDAPDEAFVPLFHFDKFDTLRAGAQIEVRQTGEFTVLFHQSATLASRGPCRLRVAAMDERAVAVEVDAFRALRWTAAVRELRVRLPDGTMFVVPADPAEGPSPEAAVLVMVRDEEPDARPGRATFFHGRGRPIRLQFAHGEVVLQPGERITMLLQPRHDGPRATAPLHVESGALAMDGAAALVTGAEGAVVHWSGARFRPPAGRRLRLDPLQGTPFAAPAEPR